MEYYQTSYGFALHSTFEFHYYQIITLFQSIEEFLLKKYQRVTATLKEQKDRHIKRFLEIAKTWTTVSTYSKEDNNPSVLDEKECEVVKNLVPGFPKNWSMKDTKRPS